jgi:5'-deoxynucleotidase YfbR-like HD superfamily hydrolase/nucleoside phosphorylase
MSENTKADVTILVALQEEYEILAPVLSKDIEPSDGRYWFTFADMNGKSRTAVISVLGNMGNEEARVAADRLITAVQPSLVVIIGIAGMLSDGTRLGEVVVATEVDNYLANGKLVDSGEAIEIVWGGRTLLASTYPTRLASSFRTERKSLFDEWKKSVIGYMNDVIPSASQKGLASAQLLPPKDFLHVGPVASGPVVGASKNFKALLLNRNRKYVALEMESAGGLAAAYDREIWPTTIVMRGLSDPSDERKALLDDIGSGVVRRWAMYNAATLLNLFLRRLPIWTDSAVVFAERPKNAGPASVQRDLIHQKLSAVHLGNLYRERPSEDVLERIAAYLCTVTKSDGLSFDKGSYLPTLADQILKSGHSYPLRVDGEPGTGKTTLLSTLYWYLYNLAEMSRTIPFPVYLNVQHFDDLAYDDNGKRRPETEYTDAIRNELEPLINYTQSGNSVVTLVDGLDVDARFRSSVEKVLFKTDIGSVKKIVSVAPGLANTRSLPPELDDPERVLTLLPVRADSAERDEVINAFSAFSGISANIATVKLIDLAVDSIDLATLNMLRRTIDRQMFKNCKSLSDVYITWCEYERSRSGATGTLLDTAKMAYDYTFKSAAFDGSDRTAAKDWRLIRSHSNVRHCLIAWLIVRCLTDPSVPETQRLDILDHVYTFTINRFCKELLNTTFNTQERALKNIQKMFAAASVTLKTCLAYMLGRFENASIRDAASKFLREWTPKLTAKPATTRQELMLMRTCFVSLARLGDTQSTTRHVMLMMKDRELDDLNRGFHLEYYGDVENYEASVNDEHRDHLGPFPKTAERLTQKLEDGLENGSEEPLEIEIFTLCSLAQHRQVAGTLFDDDRVAILELVRKIESSDLIETVELRAYLQMVEKNLSDKAFTVVTPLERLYELKVLPRSGWLQRQVKLPIESVAAHSFGAFLLGLYFLPASIPNEPGYVRDAVLLSVLTHDLAEAWTGDLLPSEKDDGAREQERKWYEYLGLLSTYPAIGDLAGVETSWRAFEDRTTFNGALAKDLDRLDQLMQLLIYLRRDAVIADADSWKREITKSLKTTEGKRILRLLQSHFENDRTDDYESGFVPGTVSLLKTKEQKKRKRRTSTARKAAAEGKPEPT